MHVVREAPAAPAAAQLAMARGAAAVSASTPATTSTAAASSELESGSGFVNRDEDSLPAGSRSGVKAEEDGHTNPALIQVSLLTSLMTLVHEEAFAGKSQLLPMHFLRRLENDCDGQIGIFRDLGAITSLVVLIPEAT